MQHDLVDVLKDPLRFAAQKGQHILDDPLAVPGKTLNYARYDFVRVFNSLVEVFGLDNSAVEKLAAKLLAVPARRFLRMKRRISFLASDPDGSGRARLVRGTYQSPILVQWGRAENGRPARSKSPSSASTTKRACPSLRRPGSAARSRTASSRPRM